MTKLYNCRHDGDQFRITKFDADMNVESSYLCTHTECECPAGVRDTCRHRQMLPQFIAQEHVGDEYCYDYDRGGWVQMQFEYDPDPACNTDNASRPLREAVSSPSPSPSVLHEGPKGKQIQLDLTDVPHPQTDRLLATPEFAKPFNRRGF